MVSSLDCYNFNNRVIVQKPIDKIGIYFNRVDFLINIKSKTIWFPLNNIYTQSNLTNVSNNKKSYKAINRDCSYIVSEASKRDKHSKYTRLKNKRWRRSVYACWWLCSLHWWWSHYQQWVNHMKLVMIDAFPRARYFLTMLGNAFTIALVSNVIKHTYSLGSGGPRIILNLGQKLYGL